MKESKITNEDIKLLKEMKDNCLKLSVYEDEKRLLKANAITKFLIEHEEKQELIDYLKKEINKIHKEIEHYDLWHETGTDINFLILRKQMFKEILSKIEKE